jgi:hypothetical protein
VTDDARLDARVRSVLTDLPVPDEAATRAALVTVLQRSGGRRTDRGPWVVPAAAAAAVLAVAALATAFLGRSQPEHPAPAEPASVVGSWERQVSGARLPGWDGGWRMTLSADGVLTLAGPATATDSSEGASYADSGGRLRVDAFVNSACAELPAGVYAWNRDAQGLTLTLVEDPCDARPDLFAGRWLPAP